MAWSVPAEALLFEMSEDWFIFCMHLHASWPTFANLLAFLWPLHDFADSTAPLALLCFFRPLINSILFSFYYFTCLAQVHQGGNR